MKDRIRLSGVVDEQDIGTRDLIETPDRPVIVPGQVEIVHPNRKTAMVIYISASVLTAIWVFAWIYRAVFDLGVIISSGQSLIFNTEFFTSLALFLGAPAIIWLAAIIGVKALEMTSSAADLATAADRMMQPETTAAFEIATVGRAVQTKVDKLNTGLEQALARLSAAEDIIRHHAGVIEDAADDMERRAGSAADRIVVEREKLETLSNQLTLQSESVSNAVAAQIKSASEISERAEIQFRSAEERLHKRVDDLKALSDSTQTGVEVLADTLSEQTLRLDKVAERATDQTDRALTTFEQRFKDLSVAEKIFLEQNVQLDSIVEAQKLVAKEIAERLDRHVHQIRDVAETGLRALEDSAKSATSASRAATEEFADHARLTASVGESAAAGIIAAVAAARDAADVAKRSAEEATASLTVQEEITTKTINSTTEKAEAACKKSAAAIEDVMAAAQSARETAMSGLEEFDKRLADMPESAQTHGREVRDTLQGHLDAFHTSVEEAFDKTRSLEQAFNDRMRKNFEILGNMAPASGVDSSPVPPSDQATQPSHATAETSKTIPTIPDEKHLEKSQHDKQYDRLHDLAREIVLKRRRKSEEHIERTEQELTADNIAPLKKNANWSWRDILAKADAGEETLASFGGEDFEDFVEESDKIITALQEKSMKLVQTLNGKPEQYLIDRFLSGERNIFAESIAAEGQDRLRQRVQNQMKDDHDFSRLVHGYLGEFDALLEQAAERNDGDALMETYLASLPGRAYLALGSAVGYFA